MEKAIQGGGAFRRFKEEESWHYRSSNSEDWKNMQYDIYKTANNIDKQIAQAKKLLLMGDENYESLLNELFIL